MEWVVTGVLLAAAALLATCSALLIGGRREGGDGEEVATDRAILALALLVVAVALAAVASTLLARGAGWRGDLTAYLAGVLVVSSPLALVWSARGRSGRRR